MPKKNQTKGAARKAGKNLLSRKNRKKQGRKGRRGPGQNTPAVIANSLFALTLNSVPGVMVESNKSLQGGTSKMYEDLLLCYNKLISAPGSAPRISADDLPVEQKISALMKLIRRALHKKMEFNIEQIDGNYCIVLYYRCVYANYLPCLVVGNSLIRAKKEHPRVHDLFVSFLKTFISITCVDTWFDSNYQYSIEGLKDTIYQIENDEGPYAADAEPEWIEAAKKDIELYEIGLPAIYEKLIGRRKRLKKVDDILKSLRRFKNKHPFFTIIKQGCDIIDPRFSMYKYGYNPDLDAGEDDVDSYCLEFACQAMIHWNYEGPVCDEFDQWVDCQANEGGIKEPICKHIIDPKSKEKFDEEEFKKMCLWPPMLVDFFSNANQILLKYGKR